MKLFFVLLCLSSTLVIGGVVQKTDKLNTKQTGHSKILIATGYNFVELDDVEIVDLSSSETSCTKPENFPIRNVNAAGGLNFDENPIICGGLNGKRECHVYEDGTWKATHSLVQGRHLAAMIKSPYQDGNSALFITGGIESEARPFLSTVEILTPNGWELAPALPELAGEHCIAAVNSFTVMVIGGIHHDEITGKSFVFSTENNYWNLGPELNTPRSYLSCGSINKDLSGSSEKSLIVVGGYDGNSRISSVEVLDPNSDAWRQGPDFPIQIGQAAMVEDPSGGVILVGGLDGDDDYKNTLYRLPHAGSDARWELLPQTLGKGRYNHVAILITDELADCN